MTPARSVRASMAPPSHEPPPVSSPPPPKKTLADRAAAGAAWALAGRGLNQVLGLVLSMVLYRLLRPSDYGLIGMVLVFVYVLSDVRDLRFSDALIQRKNLDDLDSASAFLVQAGMGLLLSLALAGTAPLLARWVYNLPDLAPVALALGLKPFLDSIGDVPRALLVRRMAFKRIAMADIGALVISGGLAILLAAQGFGPWALVGLSLTNSMATSAFLLVGARWLPRPLASVARLREMRQFSLCLYGARLLGQVTRNVDKLLIGRFLGAISLGIYGQAFRLMMIPLEQVAWQIGRVMFAALSEIQDDLERVRSAYLRAMRLLSLVTFPLTVGLCVTASEFVLTVMGPKWADAINVIRVLALVGLVESVTTSVAWIFFARGRTDLEFAWSWIPLVFTVAAVAIGLRYGIEGVAVAYLIRTLLLGPPAFFIAFRLIGLRIGALFRHLAGTALATAIMAGIVLGLREATVRTMSLPAWSMLLLEVGVGAAVYVGLLWVGKAAAFTEALQLLRGMLERRRQAREAGA